MRWVEKPKPEPPKRGDERVVRRFLWFALTLPREDDVPETRLWETVMVRQVFQEYLDDRRQCHYDKWCDVAWEPGPSHSKREDPVHTAYLQRIQAAQDADEQRQRAAQQSEEAASGYYYNRVVPVEQGKPPTRKRLDESFSAAEFRKCVTGKDDVEIDTSNMIVDEHGQIQPAPQPTKPPINGLYSMSPSDIAEAIFDLNTRGGRGSCPVSEIIPDAKRLMDAGFAFSEAKHPTPWFWMIHPDLGWLNTERAMEQLETTKAPGIRTAQLVVLAVCVACLLSAAVLHAKPTPRGLTLSSRGMASWYSLPGGARGMQTAAHGVHRGAKLWVWNPAKPSRTGFAVTVTDSGPYVKGRVLDLSRAAFTRLYGSTRRGVGPVAYRVLSDGNGAWTGRAR